MARDTHHIVQTYKVYMRTIYIILRSSGVKSGEEIRWKH